MEDMAKRIARKVSYAMFIFTGLIVICALFVLSMQTKTGIDSIDNTIFQTILMILVIFAILGGITLSLGLILYILSCGGSAPVNGSYKSVFNKFTNTQNNTTKSEDIDQRLKI